ncbi:hypothetical protein ACEPAI_6614 [Sanghuangporus weigelae]
MAFAQAGHWPFAHAVLYVEASTRAGRPPETDLSLEWNQECPAPWFSMKFAEYLGLGSRAPKRGVIDSLNDEKDVMLRDTQVYGDKVKFAKLRAFLNEFERRYNKNKKSLDALVKPRKKDTEPIDKNVADGAGIWMDAFNKLWSRPINATNFDKYLVSEQLMPWQRCEKLGIPWHPWESDRDVNKCPAPSSLLDHYKDILGWLFGEELLEDLNPVPLYSLPLSLLNWAYMRHRKKGVRAKKKVEKMDEDIKFAKAEVNRLVDENGPDNEKAEAAMKLGALYAKYVPLKSLFVLKSQKESLQKERDDFKAAMQSALGVEGDTIFSPLGKKLETLLKGIRDEKQILRVEDEYLNLFGDTTTMAEFAAELDTPVNWVDDDGDLGVEEFKSLDEEQLKALLGIPAGSRFPFLNRWRSVSGDLPADIRDFDDLERDADLTSERAQEEYNLLPVEPHWHQYVGVAAAARRFFSNRNVLFADGVGVGKTLQALMIMCLLRYYRSNAMKEKEKGQEMKFPPIAGNSRKWGYRPSSEYPAGHVLVVVPPILQRQWADEARRFLTPKLWNIIEYPSSAKDRSCFWPRLWASRVNEEGTTNILIATFPSIVAEVKEAVGKKANELKKSSREFKMGQHPDLSGKTANTVFGRSWSLVFIDEAHALRSENLLLKAAMCLRDLTGSLILLTATPLYNAERDLVSMAIALGVDNIDALIKGEKEVKHHNAKYRKFNLGEEEIETRREGAEAFLQGGASEKLALAEEDFWRSKKMSFRIQTVQEMRRWMGDIVIRRTATSKRRDGRLISGLEPPIIRQFKVEMGREERAGFLDIVKGVNDNLGESLEIWELTTKHFFNEYRMAIGNIGLRVEGQPDHYRDKDDFEARGGVKWKLIVQLLLAIMKSDEGPFPEQKEDGTIHFPEIEANHNSSSKIVIYVEFTKPVPSFVEVLKFHGITTLECTGSLTVATRNRVLKQFADVRSSRVLILSSVGSAGLNLHFAQHLIFADMVWSGQVQQQIIGRIHRQPNEKQVYVWFPIVKKTTDELLDVFASTKEKLLTSFFETMKDPTLGTGGDRHSESTASITELDDETSESDTEETVRKRKATNKPKTTSHEAAQESQPLGTAVVVVKPKPRLRGAQQPKSTVTVSEHSDLQDDVARMELDDSPDTNAGRVLAGEEAMDVDGAEQPAQLPAHAPPAQLPAHAPPAQAPARTPAHAPPAQAPARTPAAVRPAHTHIQTIMPVALPCKPIRTKDAFLRLERGKKNDDDVLIVSSGPSSTFHVLQLTEQERAYYHIDVAPGVDVKGEQYRRIVRGLSIFYGPAKKNKFSIAGFDYFIKVQQHFGYFLEPKFNPAAIILYRLPKNFNVKILDRQYLHLINPRCARSGSKFKDWLIYNCERVRYNQAVRLGKEYIESTDRITDDDLRGAITYHQLVEKLCMSSNCGILITRKLLPLYIYSRAALEPIPELEFDDAKVQELLSSEVKVPGAPCITLNPTVVPPDYKSPVPAAPTDSSSSESDSDPDSDEPDDEAKRPAEPAKSTTAKVPAPSKDSSSSESDSDPDSDEPDDEAKRPAEPAKSTTAKVTAPSTDSSSSESDSDPDSDEPDDEAKRPAEPAKSTTAKVPAPSTDSSSSESDSDEPDEAKRPAEPAKSTTAKVPAPPTGSDRNSRRSNVMTKKRNRASTVSAVRNRKRAKAAN